VLAINDSKECQFVHPYPGVSLDLTRLFLDIYVHRYRENWSTQFIPFLVPGAVVGILHTSAADHWVTIRLLGRTLGWTNKRLFGVSLATSFRDAMLFVALGLGVVFVGLAFSSLVSLYLTVGISAIMVVIGLIIRIRPLIRLENEMTPEQKL
jgi:hypothetical protein